MEQSASCCNAQEQRYIGFLCCIPKESYCTYGLAQCLEINFNDGLAVTTVTRMMYSYFVLRVLDFIEVISYHFLRLTNGLRLES